MLKKIVNIKLILFSLLAFSIIFSSCSSKTDAAAAPGTAQTRDEFYFAFEDDLGYKVELKEKPDRVAALTGSYGETWILAGGSLAGTTEDLASERGIQLPEGTRIVGTVKEPNLEEILSLSPDFILLSSAVESHLDIHETLVKSGIPHGYFKVEQFEDYLRMLGICTDITGIKDLYRTNGTEVQEKIENVLSKAIVPLRPTVLFIRAYSSGAKAMDSDNFTSKILQDLETENIAEKHQSLLSELSMEEIIEEDPDYIFVTTMGNTQKALEFMEKSIENNPAWSSLSAVKNGRYIVLPKDLFHYKPNARWGESYEYMAKIIYPDVFR